MVLEIEQNEQVTLESVFDLHSVTLICELPILASPVIKKPIKAQVAGIEVILTRSSLIGLNLKSKIQEKTLLKSTEYKVKAATAPTAKVAHKV